MGWWTFTLTWLGRAHLAVVCVCVCLCGAYWALYWEYTYTPSASPYLCVNVGVSVFLCVWSLSAAFLEINTLKGIICFLLWGSSFPPHFKTPLQDNLFLFNDTFILCWYNRIKNGKKPRFIREMHESSSGNIGHSCRLQNSNLICLSSLFSPEKD